MTATEGQITSPITLDVNDPADDVDTTHPYVTPPQIP